MRLRLTALFAALALPAIASAQAVNFDLVVDGKPSGKDTYKLDKDKHGYKLTSKFHFNVHAQDGDFTNNYKFTDAYAVTELGVSVNGETPMMISYVPNKQRTEATISRVIGGSQNTDFFAIKPGLFILPPFDAGACQVFLLATALPGAPNTFNIYVPSPEDEHTHGTPADARFTKGPQVAGTINGTAVTVQTYLMFTTDFRWIFYADPGNNLLELDLPVARTSYIRQGFKLTDPPPPISAFGKEVK